jgi:DNA-binding response OmpR family regulator
MIWLCFCDATVMKTIFILEDETGIRDALQLLLSFEDYDVRSFSTVEAFNNRDLSVVPDIFILDVMMPDGNGIDVCNELRTRPETSNIPIMIMSAHAKDHEVISRCNADEFISKPFDIDAVLLKIDNLLVPSN